MLSGIGRHEELRLIGDAAAAGRSVVVGGPSGAGKSAVLSAVADRAEREGQVPIRVYPSEARSRVAMGAFESALGAELPSDRGQGGRSLGAALTERAEHSLICVDDVHLLDDAGVDALCHVIEREQVVVVMARSAAAPLPPDLRRLLDRGLVEQVRIDDLSPEATATLAETLVGGPMDAGGLADVIRLTGGNPRLVTELLTAAQEAGTIVPGRWGFALSEIPANHWRLAAIVERRLVGLDADDDAALRRVAATEPATVRELASFVGDDALARLEERRLLRLEHVADRIIVTVDSPLVRDVILATASPRAIREFRREAAALLETSAATEDAVVRRAVWILEGAADGDADVLASGAEVAFRAGDLGTAARLSRAAYDRAPTLTNALQADKCLYEFADLHELSSFHTRWRASVDDPIAELELRCCETKAAFWRHGDVEPLRELVEHATTTNEPTAAAHAASLLVVHGDITGALDLALPQADDGPSREQVMVALALAHGHRASGRPEEALASLDRVDEVFSQLGGSIPAMTENVLAGARSQALAEAGRFAEHRACVARSAALAEHIGSEKEVGLARLAEAWGFLLQGRRDQAIAAAQVSATSFVRARHPGMERWSIGVEALAEASAGDALRAQALLDAFAERNHPAEIFTTNATRAHGWLAYRRADRAEARRMFREASVDAIDRGDLANGVFAAVDMSRVGGESEAAELVSHLEASLEGQLLPALVQLISARAGGDGAALAEVARELAATGINHLAIEAFDAAAAANRAARNRTTFTTERRQLTPLTDHPALRDLIPGALRSLTKREAEIARLAATGLSSKEIGEELFISTRTVETHLSRTYDKLGVRTRGALADALRSMGAT